MASDVQFLVLVTRWSSWTLDSASLEEAPAMARARSLLASGEAIGARVVRSECKPGSSGVEEKEVFAQKPEHPAPAPCETLDELFAPAALDNVRRVLQDHLELCGIGCLELLHSHRHARFLEGKGTTLQGFVQRAALAQTRNRKETAQHAIKRLFGIIGAGIDWLRQAPVLPFDETPSGLASLIRTTAEGAEAERTVLVALASWLGAEDDNRGPNWPAKISRLLKLVSAAPEHADALRFVDRMLADILSLPAAITALASRSGPLGPWACALLDVAAGTAPYEDPTGLLDTLATLCGSGTLPETRSALLSHVAATVADNGKSLGRYAEGVGIRNEALALADLVTRAAKLDSAWRHAGAVIEGLESRSASLMQPDMVGRSLSLFDAVEPKIDFLLEIEPGLLGLHAKLSLGRRLRPQLRSWIDGRDRPQGKGTSPTKEMARAANWQRQLMLSGLPADQKEAFVGDLDGACLRIITECKLVQRFRSHPSPLEGAVAIFEFMRQGGVTRGRCSSLLQKEIAACLEGDAITTSVQSAPDILVRLGPRLIEMQQFFEVRRRETKQAA
jgi:hypothetical protein